MCCVWEEFGGGGRWLNDRRSACGTRDGARVGNGIFEVGEGFKVLFGCVLVVAAELALVLALQGNPFEQDGSLRLHGRVANKLPDITDVAAEIAPREYLLARRSDVGPKLEAFVKQKRLLVLVTSKCVGADVFFAFFSKQILLALFVCALDDELVLELLTGASDGGRCVFEDELRVAFDRAWADEVELALRNLNDGLF